MLHRCIMIFPEFENVEEIETIRRKYDPLVTHVKPHITLVFPFKSGIEKYELQNHIQSAVSDIGPFKLKMGGIAGQRERYGNFLFLNVIEGEHEIILLHENLYKGILEEFQDNFHKENGFSPHLTVGRIPQENEYLRALQDTEDFHEVFETIVKKVSVEIIDENEDSIIEMEFGLFR